MESTNWNISIQRLFEGIGTSFVGTLATSSVEGAFARTMSILVKDQSLFFQTDRNSDKYKHIQDNSNVAIVKNEYQILGKCFGLGHPKDEKNQFIFMDFSHEFPNAAKKYSALDQEVLLQVKPVKVKIWEYAEQGARIRVYDFDNKTVGIEELGY